MESFWNGFEKQAKDKKDDSSWWEKQKGLARATRKGESGLGLVLAHPELLKKRRAYGKKDALEGLKNFGLGGAAAGAGAGLYHAVHSGRPKTKGALIGAGLGGVLGGAIGADTGLTTGMLRADKQYAKRKGIETSMLGFHKFSPEAKKKYIDAYRDKVK